MKRYDVRSKGLSLDGRPMSAPIDFSKPHPMKMHPWLSLWHCCKKCADANKRKMTKSLI